MQEKQASSQGRTFRPSDTNEKASFLAHHALFQDLDEHARQEVERLATLANYAPGRILYRPGEAGTAFFLLMSGEVQLYHLSADGRKLITATLTPGATFGEVPVFGMELHLSFAEVVSNARLCVLNRYDLETLLLHQPHIARALLKILGHRAIQLEAQLTAIAFKGATARLAMLLLQLSSGSNRIEGLSHEALAERLGVYRETVSNSLRELRESGALEVGRKHVIIHNKSVLEMFTS